MPLSSWWPLCLYIFSKFKSCPVPEHTLCVPSVCHGVWQGIYLGLGRFQVMMFWGGLAPAPESWLLTASRILCAICTHVGGLKLPTMRAFTPQELADATGQSSPVPSPTPLVRCVWYTASLQGESRHCSSLPQYPFSLCFRFEEGQFYVAWP